MCIVAVYCYAMLCCAALHLMPSIGSVGKREAIPFYVRCTLGIKNVHNYTKLTVSLTLTLTLKNPYIYKIVCIYLYIMYIFHFPSNNILGNFVFCRSCVLQYSLLLFFFIYFAVCTKVFVVFCTSCRLLRLLRERKCRAERYTPYSTARNGTTQMNKLYTFYILFLYTTIFSSLCGNFLLF